MKIINLYKFSLFISFFVKIIGVIFKIQHWPGASQLLSIGLIVSLIYIIIAFVEIYKNERITLFAKLLWLFGFIVFLTIVGFIYYFTVLKPKYKSKNNNNGLR